MPRKFLDKKAQVSNYLAVVIFLFIFGLISIMAYTVWLSFVSAFSSGSFYTSKIAALIAKFNLGFIAFDYVIVILMVIFIVGTAFLNYKINTNAVFFIVTFLMSIFWGFVSYFFNYVFIQIVTQPVFNAAIGYFPRTLAICTNLHWVMLIEIVVGSIALYGKKEKAQPQTLT